MTMSVVSRLNIGAAPYAMVFRPGGLLFYRSSNTTVRKAVMDASTDAVFANTLQVTGAGASVVTALYMGGFYCSGQGCANGGGTARVNFVNLATGAVSVVTTPEPDVAQVWDGTIGALTGKVCWSYIPGGASQQQFWSLAPPAHALAQDGMTAGPPRPRTIFSWGLHNGTERLLMGVSGGGNALTQGAFIVRGPPNYFTSIFTPPNVSGIYTPISYTTQGSGLPWGVYEYQGYLYTFALAVNGGNSYPALVRFNIATGVAQVQILDAVNPSLGANFIQDFWIDQDFGRIYFAFSNLGFKLFGASLSTWPIVPDTLLVDTGNAGANSIRGVYTEPPYVYLAKTAGPTYGNQYIRIYDSELDRSRHPKRRGGELWDLIPEAAPYISP